MTKPTIKVAAKAKHKRFAQVSKRWYPVAAFAREHAGHWVRVQNATRESLNGVKQGTPQAFAPAGCYENKVRGAKVFLRFTGRIVAIDGVEYVAPSETV